MKESCFQRCPRRDNPAIIGWIASCEGVRVALDEDTPRNDDGAELARLVCGSPEGPDVGQPSISMQDYADTPLPMPELRRLHDEGKLEF